MPQDDDDFDDERPRKKQRPADDDDYPARRPANQGGNTALKIIFGVLGGLMLLGCCTVGGCFLFVRDRVKDQIEIADKNAKEIETGPAIVISAENLFLEYRKNEVAGDAKFKKKVIEVTGTVDSVNVGAAGSEYVALKAGDLFAAVNCYFQSKHKADLAKLTKGQVITIRGRCDGLLFGVNLEDCIIKAK